MITADHPCIAVFFLSASLKLCASICQTDPCVKLPVPSDQSDAGDHGNQQLMGTHALGRRRGAEIGDIEGKGAPNEVFGMELY